MKTVQIQLAKIRVARNVRAELTGIPELAESIKARGLLQPLVVRQVNSHFEVIAGHRRLQAIKSLGWESAPCTVVDVKATDIPGLQLVENLQREGLSHLEVAEALHDYQKRARLSVAELSAATGIPKGTIYPYLQHYDICSELIAGGMPREKLSGLGVAYVRETVGMSAQSRKEVLEYAVSHNLTGTALRARIANNYARVEPKRRGPARRTPAPFEGLETAKSGLFSIMKGEETLKLLFTSEKQFTEVLAVLQKMGGVVI